MVYVKDTTTSSVIISKPSLDASTVEALQKVIDSSKTKYVDQMTKYKQDDGYFAKFLAIYYVCSLYVDLLSDKSGDDIIKTWKTNLNFAAFDLRMKPS